MVTINLDRFTASGRSRLFINRSINYSVRCLYQRSYHPPAEIENSIIFCVTEIDLHRVIRKGNILKDIHNRFILYQILKAIAYIHSANVIHRDLKVSIITHFQVLIQSNLIQAPIV